MALVHRNIKKNTLNCCDIFMKVFGEKHGEIDCALFSYF